MSQRKYPEALVREVLTKHNLGYSLPELIRQYGFSKESFFRWQARVDARELEDRERWVRIRCSDGKSPKTRSLV